MKMTSTSKHSKCINNLPGDNFKDLQHYLRTNYSNDVKFCCGPYVHVKSSPMPGNNKLWVKTIYEKLIINLPEFTFTVCLTSSDEILVQFTIDIHIFTKQSYGVLNKYMNNLVKHDRVSEFGLKKRGDHWGKLMSIPSRTKLNHKATADSQCKCNVSIVNGRDTLISYSMMLPGTSLSSNVGQVHRATAKYDRAKVQSRR